MTFQHVILTRFNLATPGKELAIRTQPGWLAGRFELFERYCLPSIGAQTCRDFRWIVYFDEGTPQEFRDRIEVLRGQVDFHPYYTGLFDASGWPRSVREVVAPSGDHVLSTRLDNDDALAADFVERVQDEVRRAGCRPGAYNFRNGVIRSGSRLYAIRHDKNAFFSLLEANGPALRTANSIQHMTLDSLVDVRQIEGAPAWMQIVHETNVSNKVRGRLIAPDAIGAVFGGAAASGLEAPGALASALDKVVLEPVRVLRDTAVSVLRGLRR